MFLSTFGKWPCIQCGASIIAPLWSEYVDECQVRHQWTCDDCQSHFEERVTFGPGGKIRNTVAALDLV